MPAPTMVAAFMFHEVTDDPASSGFRRPGARAYKHTLRAFAQYLDAIATAAARPALVTDMDLTLPGRHVAVTFDDGGVSAITAAAELERRGWRGHFFIVTSLIGTPGFLAADQVRALHRNGHLIGSHSHTHPNIFRDQSPQRMMEEWHTSCDRLAQLLGEPCLSASVPGGDISRRVLESANGAGLRYLFTSEPWLRPRRIGDCWMLGRFSAKAGTTPTRVGKMAQFRGWNGALVRRRLKVLATRVLPPLYRLYVRARTGERTA